MEKPKSKRQPEPASKGASSRWRPALEVGVPAMDRQHRALIACAAAAGEAIAAGKPPGELDPLLADLIDRAGEHFTWEEGRMVTSAYPGYSDHRKEHANLLEQARLLRQELSSGQVSPSQLAKLFLDVWAEHHIARCDRPFADFLKTAQPRNAAAKSASRTQSKKRGVR